VRVAASVIVPPNGFEEAEVLIEVTARVTVVELAPLPVVGPMLKAPVPVATPIVMVCLPSSKVLESTVGDLKTSKAKLIVSVTPGPRTTVGVGVKRTSPVVESISATVKVKVGGPGATEPVAVALI
jgi:hypothetical protein